MKVNKNHCCNIGYFDHFCFDDICKTKIPKSNLAFMQYRVPVPKVYD